MKVVDIKTCSDICHEHDKNIVVVVDNTFMSAYFQVRTPCLHSFCSNSSSVTSCSQLTVVNSTACVVHFFHLASPGFRSRHLHVFSHQIHERYVVYVFVLFCFSPVLQDDISLKFNRNGPLMEESAAQ